MLRLNLLSIEHKELVKTTKINMLARHVIFAVMALTVFVSIVLAVTYNILFDNFSKVTQVKNETGAEFNQEINNINRLAIFFKQIQDEHYDYSKVLTEIGQKTPPNIKLNALKIDQESKVINISGFAGHREGLLDFEKNLGKSLYLTKVDLPLQSITQKEDINFTIKAKLKLENIK